MKDHLYRYLPTHCPSLARESPRFVGRQSLEIDDTSSEYLLEEHIKSSDSDFGRDSKSPKRCSLFPSALFLRRPQSSSDETVGICDEEDDAAEVSNSDDFHIPSIVPFEKLGLKYSHRSIIGDGSRKQVSNEKRDLYPNACHCRTSHWSHRNKKEHMQDRYAIEEFGRMVVKTTTNCRDESENTSISDVPATWIGVFDGHSGHHASQYCVDRLSAYVRNQPHYPDDLASALRSGFATLDADFVQNSSHTDGSTACVCIVVGGKKIICANAGDSRAIVVKRDGSTTRQLNCDHKPGVAAELERITDLGGRVIYGGSRWRLEGKLSVSRGVGDSSFKPFVTADPDTCEYIIGTDDMFLIVATDGIWDVLNNTQVAHKVTNDTCIFDEEMKANVSPEKLKWTARKLCSEARKRGSKDNLTAIVVDLQRTIVD